MAVSAESSCAALGELPCVFIIALGRSGSSHLLRLLNSVPGYRISGETDNAWLYFTRFARAQAGMQQDLLLAQRSKRKEERRAAKKKGSVKARGQEEAADIESSLADRTQFLPVCELWPTFQLRAAVRAKNWSKVCRAQRHEARTQSHGSEACRNADTAARAAAHCHKSGVPLVSRQDCLNPQVALYCPIACGTCRDAHRPAFQKERPLCAARKLVCALHNPEPRARVFGFKEIYSPWIRKPEALDDVFDGVGFLRSVFPKAKFIFHWRENMTRVADSDFWKMERQRASSVRRFDYVSARYYEYVQTHTEHAFATTLEGITMTKREHEFWQLEEIHHNITIPRFRRAVWQYQAFLRQYPQRDIKVGGNAILCQDIDDREREFWKLEGNRNVTVRHFRRTVMSYQRCFGRAPRADRRNQLDELFQFLGEPLTAEMRSIAREDPGLRDWSEETHTRRLIRRLANGTVVSETKEYAYVIGGATA